MDVIDKHITVLNSYMGQFWGVYYLTHIEGSYIRRTFPGESKPRGGGGELTNTRR